MPVEYSVSEDSQRRRTDTTIMPNCPDCHTELKEIEGDFICKNCKQLFTKDDLEKAQRPWYKNICADESLWHKKVFNDYPSVIAHEYWRLYDLLEKGQTYGAFLQLKDVFEVLLKFPTLIVVNTIYARKERTDTENKVLITLLEKNLSLGDWCKLASLCKKFDNINKDIACIIKDISILYDRQKIPHWRNNELGHGALKFDIDHDFQKDIEQKIAAIAQHFEKCDSAYSKCHLYVVENEQKVILHGKDNARNLNHSSSELLLEIEDVKHSLSPYILLHNHGIYFFDSYYISKDSTGILNYPDGKKLESRRQEVPNNFVSALYKELEIVGETGTSVEDETYSALAEEVLNKVASIDDFQKPLHLEEWLNNAINGHSKGVFLLQMERGMGKTTYARALDEQSLNETRLKKKGFSRRVYYIDNAYRYRTAIFADKVSAILRQDKEGKHVINPGTRDLPTLSALSDHPGQDFADLLNFYQREHSRHFDNERLLFVIDGLDEIPATADISVFDFIPPPDELNDGVYLLFTCRTDAELVPFVQNKLKTLKFTETLCIQRENNDNIRLLTSYIKNQIKRTDPKEIAILLGKAENRFLYLKMLRETLSIHQESAYGELPEGKVLFETFLNHLSTAYGEKFFAGVIRLLCILATAFEPLTVKEISYLYGEDQLTFKLLAHLIDLRGFLNAERSYRGSLFSLVHEELKELMKKDYMQVIQDLVREWTKNCIMLTEEHIHLGNDGEVYLLAYLMSYVSHYSNEKDEQQIFNHKHFFDTLAEIAAKLGSSSLSEHHQTRTLMMYHECIKFGQLLLKQNKLGNKKMYIQSSLATAIRNRGIVYHRLHNLQEAMENINQAILIIKNLLNQGERSKEKTLAVFLVERGSIYDDLRQPQKAIADYNKAIEIQQRLSVSESSFNKNELAESFVNRSFLYIRISKLQEAIKDCTQAIRIWQKDIDDRPLIGILGNLASAYMNRGAAYLNLSELTEAITDFDQAIQIYRGFSKLGKLEYENVLAKALMNRGTTYKNIQTPQATQKAIEDHNEAIAIQQKLFNIGTLLNKNELAMTLISRGVIYDNLQMYDNAMIDYNQGIAIFLTLKDEKTLLDENELAKALVNRGVSYRQSGKLQEAINDYTQAISIQQQLFEAEILLDKNDLAKALINRGLVYQNLSKFHEAIADYTQVIKILEKQINKRGWGDESILAKAFEYRGILHDYLQDSSKAIDDFQQSISIHLRFVVEKKSLDKANELARVLIYLGNTFMKIDEISEAIFSYTRAIEIRQKLLKERMLSDENELAIALRNRGNAYRYLNRFEEAISDYNQAIEIQQKIFKANELDDNNELAISLTGRGIICWNLNKIDQALDDVSQAIDIIHSLLPKNSYLIEDYIISVCLLINIMKDTGRIETLEEIIHRFRETSKQYEIPEEAQKWIEKINKLLM